MQAIVEFITGLIVVLAATALAHLGIDTSERREPEPREIHRTGDAPEPARTLASVATNQDC